MKRGVLVVFLIFLVGCSFFQQEIKTVDLQESLPSVEVVQPHEEPIQEPEPEIVPEPEPTPEPEIFTQECSAKTDCPQGEECIDGKCGLVSQLYETECADKCNYNRVVVSTSDGEEYTLNRGQGSYSSAGALEWKLVGGPNYCKGERTIIPIKLIKKSYSEIVEEQVLTLDVGETSDLITHPDVKSVRFTATIDSINEECGKE